MVRLGKVYGNLMVDVQITNDKLSARGRRIVAQVAKVSEERAASLLQVAGGNAKTAIVMAARGVDVEAAKALLEKHGGKLREIIG
jgi:N-acetylmuramic acid 6-phosphate etherase